MSFRASYLRMYFVTGFIGKHVFVSAVSGFRRRAQRSESRLGSWHASGHDSRSEHGPQTYTGGHAAAGKHGGLQT